MHPAHLITLTLLAGLSLSSAEHHSHHEHPGAVPPPPLGQAAPVVASHSGALDGEPVPVHQPSFYAPAGVIQVVGPAGEQPAGLKPLVREQYGQPEPVALPANYKPWGSWGLYIGGNPADGYYSNYYKSLGGDKPASAALEQVAGSGAVKPALSPVLRQASAPLDYGHSYYNQADLNSGAPSVVPQFISPVQAGAQVYGAPSVFEPASYGVSSYADAYSTKKLGQSYYQQREVAPTKSEQAPVALVSPAQAGKGFQQQAQKQVPIVGQLANPAVVSSLQYPHAGHQHQLVAYPVPVASQIVGSQPGVDGSFYPHGVHAFTRYAVKPTVVSNQDQVYHYGVYNPAGQTSHKQHAYSTVGTQSGSHYPLSFYGFPLNQLHYSSGSPVAPIQSHSVSQVQSVPVSVSSQSSSIPVNAPSSSVDITSSSASSSSSSAVNEKPESDDKVKPQ